MKIVIFLSIYIFVHTLSSKAQSDKKNNSTLCLDKAEQLIDQGKTGEANLIIKQHTNTSATNNNSFKAKILNARILHETGQRVEAVNRLRQLLNSYDFKQENNATLLADTYLVLAECYFGLLWMEKFSDVSDTALQIAITYQIPDYYRVRAYTNKVRYYNYHTQPLKSISFIDSIKSIYSTSTPAEKTLCNPVAILTTYVNFYRNADSYKLYNVIDSAIKLLGKNFHSETYNQVNFWRAVGNAYFDKARTSDKTLNRHWYPIASQSFNNAAAILRRSYPANKIDIVYLNNLSGLLDYFSGYFSTADQLFINAENLLSKYSFSTENYTYAYLNTYLWKLRNTDSLFAGKELYEQKKIHLKKWQFLAAYWEKWEQDNQVSQLNYYRNVYATNPYSIIVLLCHDLYQYKNERQFIEMAFDAQEKSKGSFLKKRMINYYKLKNPEQPSLHSIQLSLSPEQAIISFSDAPSYLTNTFAVIVTADSAFIVKIDVQKLNDTHIAYKNSDSICRDLSTFKKVSHLTYNIFFRPIGNVIGRKVTQLQLFPSTFSSFVHFDIMLPDTAGYNSFATLPYLQNKYQIRYDFSYHIASLRNQLPPTTQLAKNSLLAFVPDYANTSFYQLPFFSASAKSLKTKYGFKVFNEKTSTLANYVTNAANARVLHIAGHGFANEYMAEDLKIAMDSLNETSGFFLTAEKIIHTPLIADLTVLALCETGLGEAYVTGSYLNMAYWFTYAGSKSCLFSYWKLDDRASVYILEHFYTYMDNGYNKSLALRLAKQDYIAQARSDEELNPVYWAGLTVIGDDKAVPLKEKGNNKPYWVLLLIIPVISYFILRRKN